MAIDAKHPEYISNIDSWTLIEDITRHRNLTDHLITLNAHDTSAENRERNTAYKERAVFYALTQQTVAGMLGSVFKKDPDVDMPPDLEYVKDNVDGQGNSIYQQSQSVTDDIIRKSRAGLFVTFPQTNGQISQADVQSGKYVSTIQKIEPEQIINWASETVGAKTYLSLVVIRENEVTIDDYKSVSSPIMRELFMDSGIFKVRLWRKPKDSDKWIANPEMIPTKHSGETWNEIPFQFIGSESNDASVDLPNMLAMSKVNRAHYRNSADYEDSVWYAGQSQPWMSAVSQEHINMMKENNMYVGSRMMLAVPEGGQFGFASAPPNPAIRQAMLDKLDMMIGLGARMITPGGVAKTVEQTAGEREVQHSVLSLIASNVSEAYTTALSWMAEYMDTSAASEMYFKLNQEFVDGKTTPAELKEIIAGYMLGSVPIGDYIRYMKAAKIFDPDVADEDYAEMLPVGGSPEVGE